MNKYSLIAICLMIAGIATLPVPFVGIPLLIAAAITQTSHRDRYNKALAEAVRVAETKRRREYILAAKSLP